MVSSDQPVLVKVNGHLGSIILNRPKYCNALTRSMLAQIIQAVEDLALEKRVRAIILTGAENSFCAGQDAHELKTISLAKDPFLHWGQDAETYRQLLETMLLAPKPIIAAVNGPAVAGGAGLVLAADIVVASEKASFGLPDARRGAISGMVTPLLAFRLGASLAARLSLTAQLVTADEAYRTGIYHQLSNFETLWASAAKIGDQIAEAAPQALQQAKQMLNETVGESLMTQLSVGAASSASSRTTPAASEGLTAFLEKRAPDWN